VAIIKRQNGRCQFTVPDAPNVMMKALPPKRDLQLATLVGERHAGELGLSVLARAQGSEVLGSLGDGLVEELEGQATSYWKSAVCGQKIYRSVLANQINSLAFYPGWCFVVVSTQGHARAMGELNQSKEHGKFVPGFWLTVRSKKTLVALVIVD